MANFELDPLFVKALRLLHSKAKDSTEQLKQLLDDGLHHHTSSSIYGQEPLKLTTYGSKKLSTKLALEPPQPPSKKISIKEDDTKRKAEKRTFDKLKQEPDLVPEIKKSRMEKILIRAPSPAVVIKDEEGSDDNTNATDIALEMGLACVVCSSFDVTSGNTLVECQDCHSLYHQECHKPLITDQEVNDPRLVWYCAKCTKNMRKMASKNQKPTKPVVPVSSKESSVIGKPIKPEPVIAPPPQTHIFKRAEPKVAGTVSSIASGNKPIGLAGLAASLSGKSHQVPKTSQPSTSKSLPSIKPSSAGIIVTKPSTAQSASSGIKPPPFPSLNLTTKAIPPSSSSSNTVQTPTTPTSSTGSFLPVKSSSASSLATISAPKNTSTASAGGNGSSSSSNALSSKSASSSSMMSADKRLQIMKKKAAAKMQEKRRLSTK